MRALIEKIAWVVLAIALGIWPREGADFPSYASWVEVFATRDVFQLQSTTISPVGVPVSQWSHAPALITNAVDRALSVVPFVQTGLHSVAWLAAVAFWWGLIGITRTITGGRPVLVLLTLAMVYIGTPAGFYSIHHSSETFSLSCFALAVYLALSAGPGRLRDTFVLGIACGLLLIVRVNLAMYVPLPVAIRAFVIWRAEGQRPNLRRLLLHALVLGLPLLAFAAQLPVFNYWMTGSHSQSPYVYGDDGFRSMDFKHPLFAAVLVHSWHGLLAYHPLFALGAVALVALALRRSLPITERILAVLGVLAVLAHLYLQAAWWCWWVGTGTFGSRTLVVGTLLVVLALARWLGLLLEPGAGRKSAVLAFVLLGFIAATCAWSYLLYLQGHSNYYSWSELLDAQRGVARGHSGFVPLTIAFLSSLGFAAIGFRRLGRAVLPVAVTIFVGSLSVVALGGELVQEWCTQQHLEALVPALVVLLSAVSCGVVAYLATGVELSAPARLPRRVVAVALVWVLVFGCWAFTMLAINVRHVTAGEVALPAYRYRSTMAISDILGGVREYRRVEGFDEHKAASKRFIESIVGPEPVRRRRRR